MKLPQSRIILGDQVETKCRFKKKKKKERSRAGEPVGESEGERVVTDYGYGAVL